MNFIKGFTFLLTPSENQTFADEKTKKSLLTLKNTTGIDTVILAFGALQDTPHSEEIDFTGSHIPTESELEEMISYAYSIGLRVVLKPMLNCRDGVWRAFINFFDLDVPCEPKWSVWFHNYTQYILRYARVAQRHNCEMLMVGCELVMSERQEKYWRQLIKEVRNCYDGLITYNTDKYQEGEVKWWDAVDVISSSGYYPINEWDENLERIKKIVAKYQKPFFFAECGCPSRKGSANIPNDWTFEGALDLEEQRLYYQTMFEKCEKYEWVGGFVCWDWQSNYTDYPIVNDGYSVYGKPVADVIKDFYSKKRGEENADKI